MLRCATLKVLYQQHYERYCECYCYSVRERTQDAELRKRLGECAVVMLQELPNPAREDELYTRLTQSLLGSKFEILAPFPQAEGPAIAYDPSQVQPEDGHGAKFVPLTEANGRRSNKGVTIVRFAHVTTRRSVVVVSCHVPFFTEREPLRQRLCEISDIAMRNSEHSTVVVAGDFNAQRSLEPDTEDPFDDAFPAQNGWIHCVSNVKFTSRSPTDEQIAIDHIFVRHPSADKSTDSVTPPAVYPREFERLLPHCPGGHVTGEPFLSNHCFISVDVPVRSPAVCGTSLLTTTLPETAVTPLQPPTLLMSARQKIPKEKQKEIAAAAPPSCDWETPLRRMPTVQTR